MGRNSKLKQERREQTLNGIIPQNKLRSLEQRSQKVAMIEDQLRTSGSDFIIPSHHAEKIAHYIQTGEDYEAVYPQFHLGKLLIVELRGEKSKPCHYIIRTIPDTEDDPVDDVPDLVSV